MQSDWGSQRARSAAASKCTRTSVRRIYAHGVFAHARAVSRLTSPFRSPLSAADLEALSGAGAIWSFNFIFFNPKLNRALFFGASARLGPPVSPIAPAAAAFVQKRARLEGGGRASGNVGVADSDDGRSTPRDSERNILVEDDVADDDEGDEDGVGAC